MLLDGGMISQGPSDSMGMLSNLQGILSLWIEDKSLFAFLQDCLFSFYLLNPSLLDTLEDLAVYLPTKDAGNYIERILEGLQ